MRIAYWSYRRCGERNKLFGISSTSCRSPNILLVVRIRYIIKEMQRHHEHINQAVDRRYETPTISGSGCILLNLSLVR